jgi:type I restriction enzyme S subunit
VEIKEGYKRTEVGVIPLEWECLNVEDCVSIKTGSKNTEDKQNNGIYPFYVRSQQIEKINSFSFNCEAVLTAGDGVGTGKVFHYINGKFNAHQRVYVMSDFKKVNGKYFYNYFCDNFYSEVCKYTAKSSVDSVRRDMIAKMLIPIPPLSEQQAIANALSDIDGLISSLTKLIDKKKNIKQGAMQELLTGKKRLEGFSGKLIKVKLGELCEIKDGTHQTPKYVDSGIPFYSVESVSQNEFKNTKFISEEEHAVLTKSYKIEKGDILMTRIGSIGKFKYINWDVNASFYVSLALLKVKKQFCGEFICQYSETEYFKQEIELNSLQSAIPKKINLGQISNVGLLIPSTIEEQTAITKILSNMDKEIENLTQKLTKYKNIKQGMMQELLTGRIRLIEGDM